MNKNWNTLQKNDILYLYIPMKDDVGRILYKKQESKVISTSLYNDLVTYIKFKYTDVIGKRHRLNLGVNRTKYDHTVVSTDKTTEYAREFPIKYYDFLVSYVSFEEINNQLKLAKVNKIQELNNQINEIKIEIDNINNINILEDEI